MYDSLVNMSTCSSPFSWHTFSPSMKNHSAYNIQIYMSMKETRYLNLLDTWIISLEQCFGESLSKFCVMSTLRLLNLEIALSAYFGNRRLSTKPWTKRGWEDHCRNIFSRFLKLKSSTVVAAFQFNSVFTCETCDEYNYTSGHVNKDVPWKLNNMCQATLFF